MRTNWPRAVGRVILVMWAGFWLLFALLSRIAESFGAGGLPTLLTRGGAILVLVLAGWFVPRVGGWLWVLAGVLLLGGAFDFVRYAPLLTRAILGVPPIVTGALLLWAEHRSAGPAARGEDGENQVSG